MKCYQYPYALNSAELLLLKIDYPYNEEELEKKLDGLTKRDGVFLNVINQSVPILHWFHEKGYTEIDLIDQEIFNELKKILEKQAIEYKVTDLTHVLINDSSQLNPTFKQEVLCYIDRIMDLDVILDRILENGSKNLHPFELFYLERLANGTVTF